MEWKPAVFYIAHLGKVKQVSGLKYRGLGMWAWVKPPSDFPMPCIEGLYHLGSGHLSCILQGDEANCQQIATEIAEAGDWTFDSLRGHRNIFPEALERLEEIVLSYPKASRPNIGSEDEALARAIRAKNNQ